MKVCRLIPLFFLTFFFLTSFVGADEPSFNEKPVFKLVAESDALVLENDKVVRWKVDGDATLEAKSARGRATFALEKNAVELENARFEFPTPTSLRNATAWTLVAVAEADESYSIGVLSSRDGAAPLIQLDVDENDRARCIVRDASGATIAATTSAIYRKPTFLAAVFETKEGVSSVRTTVGTQTAVSDAKKLAFPLFGKTLQIGGLDFSNLSFSWKGSISEVALFEGAASQETIERLRDEAVEKSALDLSPESKPRAPDSYDVLARPQFEGKVVREIETDVCVVGAGSAGCAAAIAAGREGAKVALIERQKRLGGTGSNAFVSNWEGGPGDEIARELYERMRASGGAGVAKERPHPEIKAPMGLKIVDENEPYENSLVRANPPEGGYRSVAYLPGAFDKAARDILAETGNVEILDESTFFQAEQNEDKTRIESVLVETKEGVVRVKARAFVDSTGDVWLCRAVGCETFVGSDPKSRFGEEGAPEEESLQLNAIARCYLIEPRENPKREIVDDADKTSFPQCAYVSGWLDGPRSVNMLATLPGAALLELGYDECLRRSERIVRNHWNWLQTQPGFENYELTEIAPMLGIREGWRVKTKYVLVESDLAAGWENQKHNDMIAVADHPCDVHGEGGKLLELKTAYGVPFRCLIPDCSTKNLLVACRGAGFSKIAAASCRLQRTMIQLGNAAGVAAAWAARDGVAVDEIDVEKLVKKENARERYPVKR